MQNIFPIIFVLDNDGTGSIGHVTLHLNIILLIECAHVTDLYGHAGLCYMTVEAWSIMDM